MESPEQNPVSVEDDAAEAPADEAVIPEPLKDAFERLVYPADAEDLEPEAVATDEMGEVYVARRGERVVLELGLDQEMKLREALGMTSDQLDARGATVAHGFQTDWQDDDLVGLSIGRRVLMMQLI